MTNTTELISSIVSNDKAKAIDIFNSIINDKIATVFNDKIAAVGSTMIKKES